jgi:hypothetical protein
MAAIEEAKASAIVTQEEEGAEDEDGKVCVYVCVCVY